jgi:hypothetical protein
MWRPADAAARGRPRANRADHSSIRFAEGLAFQYIAIFSPRYLDIFARMAHPHWPWVRADEAVHDAPHRLAVVGCRADALMP